VPLKRIRLEHQPKPLVDQIGAGERVNPYLPSAESAMASASSKGNDRKLCSSVVWRDVARPSTLLGVRVRAMQLSCHGRGDRSPLGHGNVWPARDCLDLPPVVERRAGQAQHSIQLSGDQQSRGHLGKRISTARHAGDVTGGDSPIERSSPHLPSDTSAGRQPTQSVKHLDSRHGPSACPGAGRGASGRPQDYRTPDLYLDPETASSDMWRCARRFGQHFGSRVPGQSCPWSCGG
jgi:hypothetical protein